MAGLYYVKIKFEKEEFTYTPIMMAGDVKGCVKLEMGEGGSDDANSRYRNRFVGGPYCEL